MAHCNSKPKKMKNGGPAAPVMPKEVRKRRNASMERTERPPQSVYKEMMMGESGKTISDADRKRLRDLLGETGRSVSDADRERASQIMGKVKGYKNGGCVMSGRGGKFKGIS